MYDETKSAELVRINALVEAYEREHEQEHREAGEPLQRAFLYSSAPAGEASRKYIFGNAQVVGIDAALAQIRMVADMYKIDWRS